VLHRLWVAALLSKMELHGLQVSEASGETTELTDSSAKIRDDRGETDRYKRPQHCTAHLSR